MNEKRLIIQGCRILEDGRFSEKCSVLIEDGRFKKIASSIIEEDAEVLDADGLYLIPGLMNLHVHINRRNLSRGTGTFRMGAPAIENSDDGTRMLYAARNAWFELKQGITTLRDLCSVGRTASKLKNAINSGLIHGPRMIVCGLGIAATGGHETHRYPGAVEVDGEAEVMKAVRTEVKYGADFIKVMSSGGIGGMPEHEHPDWAELSVDEISAAVFAAHTHKREVTVHAMGTAPVLAALHGGVDGIEHGTVLDDEALDIMCERNVWYVPTMSGITAVADKEERQGSKELAAVIKKLVVFPQRESVKKAKARGILIGAGSDTLGSVLKELLLFEECGFTKAEALATATSNAARIIKMDDRLGYIREGYIADAVLLRKNPLEDLMNLEEVEVVLKDGIQVSDDWLMNLC